MRPVAWAALFVLVYLMELVFDIGFALIVKGVAWLSGLPVLAVVLLSLTFISFVLYVVLYGVVALPGVVVRLSEAIYPSKTNIRYYFVGFTGLIIMVLVLYASITGYYGEEQTGWQYARDIYSIIAYISIMLHAKYK